MRTLISNGTIVTADGSYAADVLIDGETIVGIGSDLAATGVTVDETIDAGGKYVIPGAIDVHTHMELPFGGTFAKDTFETGTRAAAFGGTTTIVDFAVQSRGKSLREGLDAWHAKAEGNAVADYGFHMIMSDVNDDTLKEMDQLVAEGVPDFKLFTAYPGVFYSDDGAIFRAMQQTAKNGGLIMMHAENGLAIDIVAADLANAGKTDPYFHGVARYPIFEGEATNRVIRLAEAAGVPVYIVHLSARDALDEVRAARDRGAMTFAETCPQYLFLSLDDLGNGFEGAKFVCSPPLRPKDHWDELWKGLIKDDLQLVATDHCPFDFEGQKDLGKGDFRKVPNGLPGVEDRVDLLHDGGVVAGRISRERWVEIIATAPAKLFGMYPQKGAVAVGSDADLVVYDPAATHTISATTHHMDVDYSCYEGRSVTGRSDVVLSRGSVIVRNGEFTGRKGAGRFVKRSTADFVRLAEAGPAMVETARTVRIDADLAQLAGVRQFIRATAVDAGAPRDCLEDLVQAVDEAATNVITHGYEGAAGWLDVSATTEGENLVIRIEDAAPAFDPTTRPEPDLTVPPMHRRPGGMGVHLIREAMDSMTYRPRPGGGNILTLVRSMRPRQKEAG